MTKEERLDHCKKIIQLGNEDKIDQVVKEYIVMANGFSNMFAKCVTPYSGLETPALIAGLELMAKALRDADPEGGKCADDIISSTATFVSVSSSKGMDTFINGEKQESFKLFEGKL